ncbi:hypothetical protein B0T25DRAFT_497311 [Lasiosphaeria hispida]|uniref:Zn(2)-C6 fungal-type domain-containing protein n=1 Tax=Lasiosphaeria hispida TaxID=260671 RepID=A0AAJ0MFN8_9PEZI|nr:hypothetical protein B0T25DRAFT_497311 [Lasiosphaeria hispida]
MAQPAHLRRNGMLQSCEQCRKTKVKCDHSTPKCGRCLSRNLGCVYEAAPMTRRFRAARFDQSESGRVHVSYQPCCLHSRKAVANVSPGNRSSLQPSPHAPTPTPLISPSLNAGQAIEITTPPVQTGGFVGPGSYRTLAADDGNMQRDFDGSGTTGSPGTTIHTVDRKRLDLGMQVIDFILEHSVLLQNLMHHIYDVIRMPIVPHKVMLPAVEMLSASIGIPEMNDVDAKLRTVVRIFQSSYQPIHGGMLATADQVCHSVTGENLRWETIGNILAMASLSLLHIRPHDFALFDPERRSKQSLVQPFHKITDTLISLTSVSPIVNELGVCLKYNQLLLALYRFGDSSQHLYSIFMELTSTIYSTGMHQDTAGGPTEYPGFMHQWRRRCFTAVYSMDKTIATRLGRPPLIHRNYCVLDAPLDFDDDSLTGPSLEHELLKLNGHGWNTDGRRRTTTYMRLRYLLATVREKILELYLGVNSGGADSQGKVQILLEQLQSIWNTCPDCVKYSPAVWGSSEKPHDIWFLLLFYLDYLYSIFLLFRFNAREGQSQGSIELLLSAAKDVLSVVLVFNEQREIMREVRSDFSAVVSCWLLRLAANTTPLTNFNMQFLPYGLPCADILAVELLHRPSSFVLHAGPTPGPDLGGRPRLLRAEVIRALTVYVSCLSWMTGKGGNSLEFSRDVQGRLTQILDQIIDTPTSANINSSALAEMDPGIHGSECLEPPTANLNQFLFDWDTSMYLDSQLDLFSQSLM